MFLFITTDFLKKKVEFSQLPHIRKKNQKRREKKKERKMDKLFPASTSDKEFIDL